MEQERNEIELVSDDYQKAEAPDRMYSGGLGPSIAVGAIYGRKGYLAHFVPNDTISVKFEQFLKDLGKDVKNFAWLKIYVAGGGDLFIPGQESEEDIRKIREGTLRGRKKCLDRLARAGFKEYIEEIRWAKPCHNQELILDLSTRTHRYEEDLDEDFYKEDPLEDFLD